LLVHAGVLPPGVPQKPWHWRSEVEAVLQRPDLPVNFLRQMYGNAPLRSWSDDLRGMTGCA
jgi:hypothetical protein